MSKENLKQASQVLQEVKKYVLELLADESHGLTVITIRSSLEKLINQLNFLSGDQQITPQNASDLFPPITHFMGEPIEMPKRLQAKELTPESSEKQKFLDRVVELEKQFPNMSNEKLLDKYSVPEYQNVLRGVAKRAGLDHYKEAAIDNQFIDDIRNAMKDQAEVATQQNELKGTVAAHSHPVTVTKVPDGVFKEVAE